MYFLSFSSPVLFCNSRVRKIRCFTVSRTPSIARFSNTSLDHVTSACFQPAVQAGQTSFYEAVEPGALSTSPQRYDILLLADVPRFPTSDWLTKREPVLHGLIVPRRRSLQWDHSLVLKRTVSVMISGEVLCLVIGHTVFEELHLELSENLRTVSNNFLRIHWCCRIFGRLLEIIQSALQSSLVTPVVMLVKVV